MKIGIRNTHLTTKVEYSHGQRLVATEETVRIVRRNYKILLYLPGETLSTDSLKTNAYFYITTKKNFVKCSVTKIYGSFLMAIAVAYAQLMD